MKQHIKTLLENALKSLQEKQELTLDAPIDIHIEHTRDKKFGDFASNVALIIAKQTGTKPRDIATKIIDALANANINTLIANIEIAGPGFINFTLTPTARHAIIPEILHAGAHFGHSKQGKGIKINFEFVSANPTGPLHVGHGRSVSFGAACASLLETIGYDVHREYYVNDAGRQMDILAVSVWLRYLSLLGETFPFPSNGYKGDYVMLIAKEIQQSYGDIFKKSARDIFTDDIAKDLNSEGEGDKEAHIDGLIVRAKNLLGEAAYETIFNAGLNSILNDIHDDLAEFGVTYQEWFSERTLYKTKVIWKYIDLLKTSGHAYLRDGNLWFRSTDFNDDKDRVLIRQNGQPTYFAADIAYHAEKFARGADKLVLILGADHHGYMVRIKAALQALGIDPQKMEILIVQFATLFEGKEKVQMSTRSGSFITLRELRNEVGKDAARFFYVLRKCEQHLEFDLSLAKSQSADNPVYYIQYAHARISSVFRQCNEKNWVWDKALGLNHLDILLEPHEKSLIDTLARYPEIIQSAAMDYEPHLLAHYLRSLAQDFHTYYNALPFLVDESNLRNARLCLISAVQQTLVNGLNILGVTAPESM